MATHSSVLACRIPWTEEPGGLQCLVGGAGGGGGTESDMTEQLTCIIQHCVFHLFSLCELLCTNWDTKAH